MASEKMVKGPKKGKDTKLKDGDEVFLVPIGGR
ncbi:MoaD/ThiS family protein [Fervidicola ferrireducens]|nr:MoaD/ThiS family protein [Fervidicola ferrireducens]